MDSASGVSSSSKRSGGGGRSDHRSSRRRSKATSLGRTSTNPNRLFFGCPFFKVSIPHCKYFLWLDKLTSKVGAVSGSVADEAEYVNQHFSMIQVENKLAALECRVSAIEKKMNIHICVIVVCAVAVLVAIYVSA
ncbi:hypothetical protein PIB30_050098 [Stylosanthes scabra]|uniref:Zinc finger GRF-type domain-containing protein n=1 Tax=Stylosanthes scabra TaxID=79078 RepID=A0ABU6YG55_9FABA|nr:hypothetical protein [Stylosanthes scabra]